MSFSQAVVLVKLTMSAVVAKTCAVLALAGSAAAFAPTMSLSANRRQVVQGGAAAAVAAPLLRSSPAGAASFDNFPGRAPVISILDHRGCPRKVSPAPGPRRLRAVAAGMLCLGEQPGLRGTQRNRSLEAHRAFFVLQERALATDRWFGEAAIEQPMCRHCSRECFGGDVGNRVDDAVPPSGCPQWHYSLMAPVDALGACLWAGHRVPGQPRRQPG
jgi:hypothetical protein